MDAVAEPSAYDGVDAAPTARVAIRKLVLSQHDVPPPRPISFRDVGLRSAGALRPS